MSEKLTRRRVLALSSATAIGFAGCSSDGNGGDGGGGSDGGDSGGSSDGGDGSESSDQNTDGSDGSDSTDGGESGDASDDSDSDGGETDLSNVATSEIDQIEVVSHGPTDEYDFGRYDGFTAEVMVRNAGDTEIKLEDYQIFLRALDANGEVIPGSGSGSKPEIDSQTIPPGETLAYPMVMLDRQRSDFEYYQITIECPFGERPPYCE